MQHARSPMSLDEVLPSPEWAFAFAAALGNQFGDDRILTVGSGADEPAGTGVADPDEGARSVVVPFTTADGHRGSIALEVKASFAEALERTSPDELLSTACTAAFEAARRAIAEQAVVDVVAQAAYDPQDGVNDRRAATTMSRRIRCSTAAKRSDRCRCASARVANTRRPTKTRSRETPPTGTRDS